MVIRLKPEEAETRLPRCVYLSDRQNELVVETDNKKDIFVFDHIAPPQASQIDIYHMIGEEVVQMCFEVTFPSLRDTIAASSPMGKQERERPTL